MKENTKIRLTKDGKEYILEYDRTTVRVLENQGFSIDKVTEKPMIMIPLLFKCAFLKNHKYVRQQEIDEIFDGIKNKNEILDPLITMVNECYESLLGEENSEDNAEGNVSWERV